MSVTTGMVEQLSQLRTVTWDGNVVSKLCRDKLVKADLAQRTEGWNWLTKKGVEYLVTLELIKPN